MGAKMKSCSHCGSLLPLIEYYRHRLECKMKGRTCVHCHKIFDTLSSYHLHIATCFKRIVDKQRIKNQLRNFLPSKGLVADEGNETKFLKSDTEEAVPLKGPNYSTVCSLCKQSFRSVHLFRLHLAREGLCRPKPYICHKCNREFMSSYHLLSHEKRKRPCMPKSSSSAASKGGLKVKFVRKRPKDVKSSNLNHILNSESSNSIVSEVEYAPIKSKNFYEHKIGIEPREHELLGSMQQYAADRNILKKRPTCKACNVVFASEEERQRHFCSNPSCATEDHEVLEVFKCKNVKQNETKQTARKSLPSAYNNVANVTKAEVSVPNSQKLAPVSLPPQVGVGAKFAGEDGSVGSARKSSQDSLVVQMQRNSQNEMGLSCTICRITFPDAETLQAHKKVHSAEDKSNYSSKCPVCFQVFNNAFLLFSHQKKHQHWGKSAKCKTSGCKCPFCDKVFLYVRSRNAHLRGHDDVASENIENFLKKTTCEVCSLAFVSENQKIQHRKVEHPDWTDALPKLFSNFDLRNQDSGKRNHDQKKVMDQKREVVSPKKMKVLVNITPSLKAKLKAHPNTCPICFKQYSTTFVRNRHFRMHILDKAFECKWCPLKFHRSEPLNSHMQKEHNDRLGFECLVCGLRYLTKFRVLQHISKSHNSQVPQKLVKERQIPPLLSGMKKTHLSFKNGSVTSTGENSEDFIYEDKGEYSKSKNNQDFYCEVCETSFLKLCGLQRHRQSKNHKDILAAKDPQQAAADIKRDDEPPAPVTVPLPRAEQQDTTEGTEEVNCSVCLRLFTSIIEFVPHRLSHFHHTGLSEITEMNPYTCEICTVSVDHHQKVQWHLLHHLQSAKSKKANLPQWKFSFTPKNFDISPIKITNVRLERPPAAVQVAKKTVNYNKPEKQLQKEPVLSGVHRNIFTCDACNVVFTTKHHHSAHIRRYCPVKKAAVSSDDHVELEKSSNSLRNKWRLHENGSKLRCHYCSLEFGTVDELGWHEKSCRKVNGPVNGSLEDDGDDFFFCKVCECLFPFEHSYREHQKLFCFEEESPEKLLSDSGGDTSLDRLKSAIELEAAVACCVRCSMIFLSVQKLNEHMACHIMKPKQFSIAGDRKFLEESSDAKAKHPEQNVPQSSSKTSENCGKVSFNIADILSDSTTSKKCENVVPANKVAEIGRLPKSVESSRKEEKVSEQSVCPTLESDCFADLRTDFAELLYILVSDCELMEQLGWGKRPVDLVLNDVLEHMGHNPVTSEQVNSDLDRLRQNIQILLETCISDDVMTNVSGGRKPIDAVVSEVLQMCRAQANSASALPSLVSQITM